MKVGRPTDYNEELALEICSSIATTRYGIATLCSKNSHWPAEKNIFAWIAKHPEFRKLYEKAKVMQVEVLVDQILDIADDTSHDVIIKTNKDGEEYEVCNNEYINRSRLRIDSRKWLAAKLMPKKYGDKLEGNTFQVDISQLLPLAKDKKE